MDLTLYDLVPGVDSAAGGRCWFQVLISMEWLVHFLDTRFDPRFCDCRGFDRGLPGSTPDLTPDSRQVGFPGFIRVTN